MQTQTHDSAAINTHTTASNVTASNVAALDTRTRFEIDSAHASAQFKVKHLMVSNVRGELGAITGTVLIDAKDLSRLEVAASIDVTTIDTKNETRDGHLRGADFFDVEQYPNITFRSTSVRPGRAGELEVRGDLTIRGVTRSETLQVELSDVVKDPWGNVKRGVAASARINRKDYGISWNAAMDAGGVVVAESVDITIELELVERPA